MQAHHQFGEAEAHNEICSPVGAAGNGHGSWAWPLGEELGHDEPGNGTRPQLKHGHKRKHGHDAQVAQGLLHTEVRTREERQG